MVESMLTSFMRAEQGDRSAEQVQITLMRGELAAQIERHTGVDGAHDTAIPRLTLVRATRSEHPAHGVTQPAFCVLAQGSKRVLLNGEVYLYDSSHYLMASQNLPVCGQVIDATPETPYLGLKIEFEAKDIASLALEISQEATASTCRCERGLFTGPLSTTILDPVLRLVGLLQTPADIPTLAPMFKREILYRVLTSPEGWRLAQMAVADSHGQRITQAIHWLQAHFNEPVHIEDLAREAHMSVSSLHSHFKTVTAMSPLQFQKQLRLQEARRIMLIERVDAGIAGHRVGYESQSQFNREYSRFFGAPPARDIKRLREQQLGAN
jgi:AraC-like DNA-binding protein